MPIDQATIAASISSKWPDMPPDQALERAAVVAAVRSWLRTPYHHAARVKGAGADCATLIAAAFEEAGLLAPVPIPSYSPQWHLHRNAETYRDFVLRYAHEIEPAAARPGDVVMYHWGHVKAHGGIIVETGWPNIIHAYSSAGMVVEADGTGGELAGRETQFFSRW